jgi:hypothetical protein
MVRYYYDVTTQEDGTISLTMSTEIAAGLLSMLEAYDVESDNINRDLILSELITDLNEEIRDSLEGN